MKKLFHWIIALAIFNYANHSCLLEYVKSCDLNNKMKIEEDIEYLDKEFPKGETKFRGQAMVLLALSREVGKKEALKDFIEKIKIKVLTDWKGQNEFIDWLNNLQIFWLWRRI